MPINTLSDCYQQDRSTYQYLTQWSHHAPIVSINDSSVNLKLFDANNPRVPCGQWQHQKTRSYWCEEHDLMVDLEDERCNWCGFHLPGSEPPHLQSITIYLTDKAWKCFHGKETVQNKRTKKGPWSTPLSHLSTVKCTLTVANSVTTIMWKHDTLSFLFLWMWVQVNPSIPPFISHQGALVSCSLVLPVLCPVRGKCLCLTASLWTPPAPPVTSKLVSPKEIEQRGLNCSLNCKC